MNYYHCKNIKEKPNMSKISCKIFLRLELRQGLKEIETLKEFRDSNSQTSKIFIRGKGTYEKRHREIILNFTSPMKKVCECL